MTEAMNLQVTLPSEAVAPAPSPSTAPTQGQLEPREKLLAAISMPMGPPSSLTTPNVDLEESRSARSDTSETHNVLSGGMLTAGALASTAGALHGALIKGGLVMGPYQDDDDDDDDSSDGAGTGSSHSSAGVMKRAWQAEEDTKLLQLVTEFGPCHWSIIASHLEGRVGKQCRERYAQVQGRLPKRHVPVSAPHLCLRTLSTMSATCLDAYAPRRPWISPALFSL